MSIFGDILIAFARRRRPAAPVDDRHTVISTLGILAGPGLPDYEAPQRRSSERDQQARRDVRRMLRQAAADDDRADALGLRGREQRFTASVERHGAAVLGVRVDGDVSGPEFEVLVDRRRGELLMEDLAADRADRGRARDRRQRRRRSAW